MCFFPGCGEDLMDHPRVEAQFVGARLFPQGSSLLNISSFTEEIIVPSSHYTAETRIQIIYDLQTQY
ncbi:hypothetical protein GDO81_005171 [Engystomops pustulosus]|uniref:Uncharacterized protein n=1 Tax=Engystomops pustulosus TaxID=76066 RepID=A0AAV7CLG3_ENGPU|nr:hypothetical protein GDO81_005171 [Engystomops pustulosus]